MSTADGNEKAPPVPFVHDWKAPGVRELPIPPLSWNGFPKIKPMPLHALRFTPLGIYDLHRHLGIFAHSPSIWNTYHYRFTKARIARQASGASTDNQHHPSDPGFFPDLKALRESLPTADDGGYALRVEFVNQVRELMFDVATMLDHIIGSTTLIIHSEGTTRPGTPVRPEYLSSTVYIPPAFLASNPTAHMDIARIVQQCIETVGVATVTAWATNAKRVKWSIGNSGSSTRSPNYIRPGLVIPDAKKARSSVYVFRGRPAGSLDPTGASPMLTASRDGSEEPYSQDALNLMDEIEHNHALMADIDELRGHITVLEDALEQTQSALASREAVHEAAAATAERTISSLQRRAQVSDSSAAISRVPTNMRPPSYASSSQLFTPTKTRSTAAQLLDSPQSPRSPRMISEIPLPLTIACLDNNSGLSYLPGIRLMIKHVAPTMWYEELATLGFEADDVQKLLDSLTADVGL
ncbi:hypothetical protein DFH07DRAFT_947969 [Mycena maculata]|uniref:Uncharacterized protein n=1 Tax=Mycena maculata TaxID=230809 RepID=A0AAD7KHN8_9AGAR|nr:hypothetical protein DFH07DRAFT_947969 [Mycena maculata]